MNEKDFTIEDLSEESLLPYCSCLEDWSDEMKEAGDIKYRWVEKMKDHGLGVKMARNSAGEYVGMIQYVPSEYSAVEGKGNYHIHCCWVHAYKGKGVGDWRKRGIGKSLLQAAEEDVLKRGGLSISAWGLTIPVWMRASWYEKQGYRAADREGMAVLMWKALSDDAVKPQWRKASPGLYEKSTDTVKVISYINGICPAANIGHERMKRILEGHSERVDYTVFDNSGAEEIGKRGITDALYINGTAVPLGPPPKEKKLRKILRKETKHLRAE